MTDFAEGWSTLAGALLLGVKLAVSKSASELLDCRFEIGVESRVGAGAEEALPRRDLAKEIIRWKPRTWGLVPSLPPSRSTMRATARTSQENNPAERATSTFERRLSLAQLAVSVDSERPLLLTHCSRTRRLDS